MYCLMYRLVPPDVPQAAAALLDLCSYCGSHLAPCLGQLLELYSRVQRECY